MIRLRDRIRIHDQGKDLMVRVRAKNRVGIRDKGHGKGSC